MDVNWQHESFALRSAGPLPPAPARGSSNAPPRLLIIIIITGVWAVERKDEFFGNDFIEIKPGLISRPEFQSREGPESKTKARLI
ncbi:hypothetical protein EVAR_75712_1 [Eumeta japonica]|uniref:Uncharacterized protein n=1 Tax=Eumeta variegata TaxID=151549 RepID=A0A4C1W1A9_EUMVA|nr:hypothetical protein EVAR_75712_1 [Eumeta japonica]